MSKVAPLMQSAVWLEGIFARIKRIF